MADNRSQASRSALMARIGQKDTEPEIAVRKMLHAMGYRFRLHRKDLPGKPDIVLPGRRKAIFVHGCFWHGHDCRKGRLPKSRLEYWTPKIAANAARDERNIAELSALGWQALVIWQCEIPNFAAASARVQAFLGPSKIRSTG